MMKRPGSDGVLRDATPTVPYSDSKASLVSLGYRQIPLPENSAVLLAGVPEGAISALVKVEGASVRYRDDGLDPTTTVGMPLTPGESMVYDATMGDVRFIAQGVGAILNVAFYGTAN